MSNLRWRSARAPTSEAQPCDCPTLSEIQGAVTQALIAYGVCTGEPPAPAVTVDLLTSTLVSQGVGYSIVDSIENNCWYMNFASSGTELIVHGNRNQFRRTRVERIPLTGDAYDITAGLDLAADEYKEIVDGEGYNDKVLCSSPDGNTVIIRNQNSGAVSDWTTSDTLPNMTKGTNLTGFTGTSASAPAACYNTDGTRLLVITNISFNYGVEVWDLATPYLTAGATKVGSVTFSSIGLPPAGMWTAHAVFLAENEDKIYVVARESPSPYNYFIYQYSVDMTGSGMPVFTYEGIVQIDAIPNIVSSDFHVESITLSRDGTTMWLHDSSTMQAEVIDIT